MKKILSLLILFSSAISFGQNIHPIGDERMAGYLVNQSSFSSMTGYVNHGSTVSISGGVMNFSGGTAGVHTNYVSLIAPSGVDAYTVTGKITVPTIVSGATAMVGLGKVSINTFTQSGLEVDFLANSGGNGGKIAIYSSLNGTYTQVDISPTAISFSAGDNLVFSVSRNAYTVTASIRDETTNSLPIIRQYTYSTTYPETVFMDNSGQYSIVDGGATFSLDSLVVFIPASVYGRLAVIGDSKMLYYVTNEGRRWPSQLNHWFRSTVMFGGQGDRTVEWSALVPSIIAAHPWAAILSDPGRNDTASGITVAITNARLDSIVTALQNAGILVFFAPFAEANMGFITPFVTHIIATYPASMLMPTLAATQIPGSNTPDNVHLTDQADSAVANVIETWPYINFGSKKYYGPITNGTIYQIPVFQSNNALFGSPNFYNNGQYLVDSANLNTNAGYYTINTNAGVHATSSQNYVNDQGNYLIPGISSSTYSDFPQIGANRGFALTSAPNGFSFYLTNTGVNSAFDVYTGGSSTKNLHIDYLGNTTFTQSINGAQLLMVTNPNASSGAYAGYGISVTGATNVPVLYMTNSASATPDMLYLESASASKGVNIYTSGSVMYAAPSKNALFNNTTDNSTGQVQVTSTSQPQEAWHYDATHYATEQVNSVGNLDIEHLTGLTINSGAIPTGTTTDSVIVETTSANVATIKKVAQSSLSGSGATTVGAIGGPFTNAGSISGTTLTLGVADGSHGGIIAASGSQTLAPTITFTNAPILTTSSTIGQVWMANNSSGGGGWSSPILYSQTTNGSALTNSTSATSLLGSGTGVGLTIAANTLQVGQTITLDGDVIISTLSSTPGSLTFSLNIGTASASFGFTPPTSLTNVVTHINIVYTVLTTGSSGTLIYRTTITVSGQPPMEYAGTATSDFAINTTISNTITFNGQWQTASTSNSVTALAPLVIKLQQ
jgi:hypothetical protein